MQAGGAFLPVEHRVKLDVIVVHAASTATLLRDEQSAVGAGDGWAGMELAAFSALQSSMLTPALHRPADLPEALRILRKASWPMAIT